MRTAVLSDAPLPEPDPSRPPWSGEHVVIAGTRIFLRRTPATGDNAQPALYVHGLGGASTNWTDLAGLLADRLDGAALDLPGFGQSGPAPRGDYSIAAHARTVAALIETEGAAPLHLIGNSMGGLVAVSVAARRPELVRSLTLISPAMPSLRPKRGSDPLLPLLLLPGVSRVAQRRLAGYTPEDRARAVIELCFADPSRIPENRLAEAAEEVRRRSELPYAMDAFTRSLRGLVGSYLPRRESGWALAGQVRAPTLVIWGNQDRLVDVALAPRTARTIPDARLLVLPGIGHTAQLEDPVTTARAILALLDDTP
ncbi:alpha/beta fold hydrolase [soil metagenome]